MWVFILLLLIGSTIIVTRVFRNGAREEPAEPAERRTFTPARSPSALSSRQSAPTPPAKTPVTAASSQPAVPPTPSPYPPAATELAGGACPSCGTVTVPGAKFCGECGHRLVS